MTRREAPAPGVASVLWLSREGGVAHFPGLARPRRIDFSRCSEAQRDELRRLLGELARLAETGMAGADRRLLCARLEDDGGATWTCAVAEEEAPEALLRWWRDAGPGETQGSV